MIEAKQIAEWFDLYADRLVLIARAFGDDALADDAVQEAFIALAATHVSTVLHKLNRISVHGTRVAKPQTAASRSEANP